MPTGPARNSLGRSSRMDMTAPIDAATKYSTETHGSKSGEDRGGKLDERFSSFIRALIWLIAFHGMRGRDNPRFCR